MAASSNLSAMDLMKSIEAITVHLVEVGLADDQNFPVYSKAGGSTETITFPSEYPMSAMLKNKPYRELHAELLQHRAFNVRMLDGALIQIDFELVKGALVRSRLAFLPSPDLSEFQDNADLYMEDVLYADVIDQKAVTVPLRIDFDNRTGVAQSVTHPASHLTLGQYTNCRIATTSPLTPHQFVDFVVRSFYATPSMHLGMTLDGISGKFDRTITGDEEKYVHVGVPL